jgi:hypothetical protein
MNTDTSDTVMGLASFIFFLPLCLLIVAMTTCTRDSKIQSGEPIVIGGELYRCEKKEWPK